MDASFISRLVTIAAGAIAAYLAAHVPGVNEAQAAQMTAAIMSFAIGWATKHPSDFAKDPKAVTP